MTDTAMLDEPQIVFNHDGFGALRELADTEMSEQDAADLLVKPLAQSRVTAIDWSIMTVAEHNCRTRHGLTFDGVGAGRPIDAAIGRVVAHYSHQPLDLLDIVIKHGHAAGLKVFGGLRLNHALNPDRLPDVPGQRFWIGGSQRERYDFRDPAFHGYLCELAEDLLAKGVDGIVLDFERKAPFFPEEAPIRERLAGCSAFLNRARKLIDRPLIARVAHDPAKGAAQGQDPLAWMADGLLDAVIPATHNHEPDTLDWGFESFLQAASHSPRPCRVWPQIWPTGRAPWTSRDEDRHPPQAVIRRTAQILEAGGDGAYFFNFCCYHREGRLLPPDLSRMFEHLDDPTPVQGTGCAGANV